MELSDAMVQNELLVKDNNYGVLFISQKGWEAIRNQETVELPLSFVPGQKNPKEEKLKLLKVPRGQRKRNRDTMGS